MMQSAENSRRFDDVSRGDLVPVGAGRNLCPGGLWNSWPERRVWTAPIVVDDELRDNPLEVPLAKWDEIVEALTANGPDQSLNKTVRRRCPDRGLEYAHAKGFQLLIHSRGENSVPVVDQKSIRMVEGEKFAELLDGPFRGRVIGDLVRRIRRESTSIATKTYSTRKLAVTETRKSQATMALAWFRTEVDHR